jgi:hypothetical protein
VTSTGNAERSKIGKASSTFKVCGVCVAWGIALAGLAVRDCSSSSSSSSCSSSRIESVAAAAAAAAAPLRLGLCVR